MLLQPEYAETIIVGVTLNGIFQWYVTGKSLWYMNSDKYQETFLKLGFTFDYPSDKNERTGIDVLNENTASEFLNRIGKYGVGWNELHKKIKQRYNCIIARSKDENKPYHVRMTDNEIEKDKPDDILEFIPALYVEFDKRQFFSLYPEPASYEKFAPDGWLSEYFDFTGLVPINQVYWLDDFGRSMFDNLDELRRVFYDK